MKVKKNLFFLFIITILVISLYFSENFNTFKDVIKYSKVISVLSNLDKNKESAQSSISTNTPSGDDMVRLLARLINAEARGEPYEGQVAVGGVILNRVRSPEFPNTIASVIYQKGQFSSVTDGQINAPLEDEATVLKAAQDAMNGVDPTNGALYFYNPSKTKSKWLFSLPIVATIGEHKFSLGEK